MINDKPMKEYTIYTDGGCMPNPGPGGWGAVILSDSKVIKTLKGGDIDTTNNRMEIIAVIKGLEFIEQPAEIKIMSDSKYVVNSVNQWLQKWIKNGFKSSNNIPESNIKNKDLWEAIWDLKMKNSITAYWIPGHKGIKYNEQADVLASHGRAEIIDSSAVIPGNSKGAIYSSNFDLFLENEIALSKSVTGSVTFFSRLEQRIFKSLSGIDSADEIDICKEVHDILINNNEAN